MKLPDFGAPARRAWENFNEREKKMMTALGGTVIALILGGIVYFAMSTVGDLQTENENIQAVLDQVGREGPRLRARAEERRQAERRYSNRAPALGGFLEATAHSNGLTLREVTDQPDEVANGFKKRSVRLQLPGVSLRPAIDFMAAIENSVYPVAIELIEVEHFQAGTDAFNVKMGVLAYDRVGAAPGAPAARPARPTADGTAGPPAP
ncbi:MAG: type II secretion system protein M [Sandaracinaceae bacterium]|jgi:hypothetical protein|nr:type II secretion system protein M [Sandaracinaceae bacterium]